MIEKKLCVLVMGHSEIIQGAKSKSGITEFNFNNELAELIKKNIDKVKIQIAYRNDLIHLPFEVNNLKPDFVISLHLNSFYLKSSGTEVLYFHDSKKSKQMAEILQRQLVKFLGLPNRGIKPIKLYERGGYLLYSIKSPAVIAEPFFLNNDKDLARAQEDLNGLAQAYADAIFEISIKI